jgi:AraC-like DNA-binding protein
MKTQRRRSRTLRSAAVFPDRDFPLHVMRTPEHAPTSLHAHEFTELVMILAGSGRHLTDGDEYPIAAGDVFIIRGDMAHGYADTHRMSLVNILFSPRRLRLPLADLGDIAGYHVLFDLQPRLRAHAGFRDRLRLAPSQLGEAVVILDKLDAELASNRPGRRFMACSHLMELIGHLSRCCEPADVPENRQILGIGRALSHMEQHFGERLAVGDISRVAAMSESSLTRAFRKILGRPPADYLIQLRIAKAMDLLQRGDLRITEIASRCGFNDSNYFSRQFRHVAGRSPREYRRSYRTE